MEANQDTTSINEIQHHCDSRRISQMWQVRMFGKQLSYALLSSSLVRIQSANDIPSAIWLDMLCRIIQNLTMHITLRSFLFMVREITIIRELTLTSERLQNDQHNHNDPIHDDDQTDGNDHDRSGDVHSLLDADEKANRDSTNEPIRSDSPISVLTLSAIRRITVSVVIHGPRGCILGASRNIDSN
jgi:hypothetical protein